MATKKEAEKKSSLVTNMDEVPRAHLALIGKPGSGKSTTAASLSQFFPKDFNLEARKKAKVIDLEDVIWLPIDEGALVPLGLAKLKVRSVPFQKLVSEHGILDGMSRSVDMVFDNSTKDTVVCFDTGTVYDTMMMDFWEDNAPKTRQGNRDSFAIARLMTVHSRRLEGKLMDLGCHLIINMHGKPVSQVQEQDAPGVSTVKEAQQKAFLTPGASDVRPGYYYNECANVWRQHLDCVFYTQMKVKKVGREVKLITEPTDSEGFEVKNRWAMVTNAVEEPYLRGIYKRVEESYK